MAEAAGETAETGGENRESWRDGDDPLRPSGLGFRLPKGKTLSISRPRLPEMPEPPELTVRGVGRAIGARAGNTFSTAVFSAAGEDEDFDAEDFWAKALPEAARAAREDRGTRA